MIPWEAALRAVNPISRSKWNGGFGVHSGSSRGDPCRRASRPFETFAVLGIAAIGVRDTTAWEGPIDNDHGVIVLSGEATVTGRRGTVTLKQGQGTMLFGDGKPQRAAAWPAGRVKRAVASITFGKPPAQQ